VLVGGDDEVRLGSDGAVREFVVVGIAGDEVKAERRRDRADYTACMIHKLDELHQPLHGFAPNLARRDFSCQDRSRAHWAKESGLANVVTFGNITTMFSKEEIKWEIPVRIPGMIKPMLYAESPTNVPDQ